MDAHILLIEDERDIAHYLRTSLTAHGYHVHHETTCAAGIAAAHLLNPQAIILDLGLPDDDGSTVLTHIRAGSDVPILILTARGREHDKITLLDSGADDYLTKPFGVGELLARLRVLLRRKILTTPHPVEQEVHQEVHIGSLHIDFVQRRVKRDGEVIHLTPTEYKLLLALVRQPGRVVTHTQLLTTVWGPEYRDAPHYVRIYMQHLRHKLEKNPAQPQFLVTEPGVGYRLRDDVHSRD